MSAATDSTSRIRPAQVDFLAIYNPSLGAEDGNERDQIVFFYSRTGHSLRQRQSKNGASEEEVKKEENEQLRQVGLAQGMLNFARGFSGGTPIDSIETEKHRIVLAELEKEWWILASIDLTRLPSAKQPSPTKGSSKTKYEFSVREVSPPALLIQQLFHAYQVFLLHHDTSLSNLYVSLRTRPRFCAALERYWTQFALTWDVMLHGNPAVDLYGGIKLGAGGELGIGVGEEEWGSGEREVLEGLIRNTEGLVDVTVSRYGDAAKEAPQSGSMRGGYNAGSEEGPWLGTHSAPGPNDGLIFSGGGAVITHSLRDISSWLEDIYSFGEDAYGVRSNPSSARRKRRRRKPMPEQEAENDMNLEETSPESAGEPLGSSAQTSKPDQKEPEGEAERDAETPMGECQEQTDQAEVLTKSRLGPGIPPPIVSAAEDASTKATKSADQHERELGAADRSARMASSGSVWTKYLKLGYGTAWGGPSTEPVPTGSGKAAIRKGPSTATAPSKAQLRNESEEKSPAIPIQPPSRPPRPKGGYFMTGLLGDLDATDSTSTPAEDSPAEDPDSTWSSRLSLRSLYVTVDASALTDPHTTDHRARTPSTPERIRLRVLVYAHRPFLYVLLFLEDTPHLSIPSFYHSLHHHLTPLHGPLLRSTSPASIRARTARSLPHPTGPEEIYSLIYSPPSMTLRSTLPNIPPPGTLAAEGLSSAPDAAASWTRVEALSVHSRILDLIAETRKHGSARGFGDAAYGAGGAGDGYEAGVDAFGDGGGAVGSGGGYRGAGAVSGGGGGGGYNMAVQPSERERRVKTSRGWWIVWLSVWTGNTSEGTGIGAEDTARGLETEGGGGRGGKEHAADTDTDSPPLDNLTPPNRSRTPSPRRTPPSSPARGHAEDEYKEALLVRRGGDAAGAGGRRARVAWGRDGAGMGSGGWMPSVGGLSGARFGLGGYGIGVGSGAGSGAGAGGDGGRGGRGGVRGVETGGMGVDARRYVEGLVRLDR